MKRWCDRNFEFRCSSLGKCPAPSQKITSKTSKTVLKVDTACLLEMIHLDCLRNFCYFVLMIIPGRSMRLCDGLGGRNRLLS